MLRPTRFLNLDILKLNISNIKCIGKFDVINLGRLKMVKTKIYFLSGLFKYISCFISFNNGRYHDIKEHHSHKSK